MADDPIIGEIRRLAEEAARERYERPGMLSLAARHPGVFSYQVKTQPHYERDMQTAAWLGKVAEMRERYRSEGRGVEFRDAISDDVLDAIDRRAELATPYWNRGVMASGQPLRIGLDWQSSVPSNFFNIGRAAVGREGALRDLADSANTTLLRVPEMLGYAASVATDTKPIYESPQQVAWEAERKFHEDRHIGDIWSAFPDPKHSGARILPTRHNVRYFEDTWSRGLTSGDQVLAESGMQPGLKRQLLGAGMEAALDPVSGARSGIRALIRRNFPKAALELTSEMAVPGAFIWANQALARQEDR